ncbi:MAG TPA: cobalamin B12-binding domain-containing protein [Chloroflexota bacterium]|nr:cobalamin B12-binding domain-containing protein [Chloroflexota bacterium]
MPGPIRVVLGKVGLDGHDRGVKVVARALRDAGMEVIYTGLHRTPEEIVSAAVDEDADFLGVSILSGAHMILFPRILELMREQGIHDEIVLFGGGVIPPEDVRKLKALGVAEVFVQDTPTEATVDWIRTTFEARA